MLSITIVDFSMPFLLSINLSSGMTKQYIVCQLRSHQSPAQSFLVLEMSLLIGPRTISVVSAVASVCQLREILRSVSTPRSFFTSFVSN